jgi:hypothetical protein
VSPLLTARHRVGFGGNAGSGVESPSRLQTSPARSRLLGLLLRRLRPRGLPATGMVVGLKPSLVQARTRRNTRSCVVQDTDRAARGTTNSSCKTAPSPGSRRLDRPGRRRPDPFSARDRRRDAERLPRRRLLVDTDTDGHRRRGLAGGSGPAGGHAAARRGASLRAAGGGRSGQIPPGTVCRCTLYPSCYHPLDR